MHTIIVANGELGYPAAAKQQLRSADFIIAADGGLQHCLQLGLTPDLIVGDLDSIPDALLEKIQRDGAQVSRYPRRKDATDLELALLEAQQSGHLEVTVLAAIGGRWDQSLANLQLLSNPAFDDLNLKIVDGPQIAYRVRSGSPLTLNSRPGDTVSLIPVGGDVLGVRTAGLEYALDGDTLNHGSSRGVSNVMTGESAQIQVEGGTLLCLLIRGGAGALELDREGGF
ncbi:MAG: thiamine diphosphokinase [Anaerolineales bacterium]